jgi:hypothetical protein
MESNVTDKPVPREINALLSDERLILRETQRAVTPFGGIAVFISFLEKIGFVKAFRQHMPVVWRSPNHIDPSFTFTAFLVSVLLGARRFAHASLLRGDRRLQRRYSHLVCATLLYRNGGRDQRRVRMDAAEIGQRLDLHAPSRPGHWY